MKKVLFVAYQIPPIGGPAVQRHLRFLSRLPECGWAPYVLTIKSENCEDYYPQDQSLCSQLPAGVPLFRTCSYNPMERLLSIKASLTPNKGDSIAHISTAQANGAKGSEARKGLIVTLKDFVSELFRIPDRQIGWYFFAVKKGLEVMEAEGLDVIYTSGSPWTAHLIGLKLAQKSGLPWVADFRDPWTINPYRQKRFPFFEAIEARMERAVVEGATYVVANTKPLKKELVQTYPQVSPEKIVHIGNGYNGDLFNNLISLREDKKFIVAHVGSLYANRSPVPILRAIAHLKKEGTISKDNFLLRFIGTVSVPGVGYDMTLDMGIEELVHFCPPVPHAKALQELASSDVLLIIQPGTKLQIPAKIFEYIAVGKPIFAITDEGATADLVRDECLGVVSSPHDTADIIQKIIVLFKLYSVKSLPVTAQATRNKFESLQLTRKLSHLFENCIEREID